MEVLSSSFLPTNPHLHTLTQNRSKTPQRIIITTISAFNTFHHHPKKQTLRTFQNIPEQEPMILNKQKPSNFLATIFNSLDDFICAFLDLPLRPSIDPKNVLSENFAPVAELPPTACEVVEGSLPPCLDGAYIRNGPNPQFGPKGPYHVLDGDGMLHMIRISRGGATFCSRYVDTHKHAVERDIGYPIVPNFFAAFNGIVATISRFLLTVARVFAGQFDPVKHGFGTANTSLALIAGQLYALCESDLPYAIQITPNGDIITLGRHDFHSPSPFSRMTAHPKTDPTTAEVFAFRYNITSPFLTLFRISSDGTKQKDVPIHSILQLTAMHDFAITENHCIIPDVQIVVNPLWILRGRSPVGVDDSKVPRLGIIPKHAKDEMEMRWIDVPGLNMLHCVNAWEEDGGETVIMVASNAVSVEQVFERFDQAQLTLEKVTVDVRRKRVERQRLSEKDLEFGVVNPAYTAKKNSSNRHNRITRGGETRPPTSQREKSRDCTVASRLYRPGCYGSEVFFVARDPNNPMTDEDDGYLVTYMHDETNQESKFLIMDAKSPTLDIIVAVRLPQRVPNGFHGLFVPEKYFDKQPRI